MSVGEVIERLNSGTKAAALAKELHVSDKKMREALKKLGFQYSNSTRSWTGDEASQEWIGHNIYAYVPTVSIRETKSTSQTNNNEVKKTPQKNSQVSNIVSPKSNAKDEIEFTSEQILALKEIANEWINEKENETKRDRLHKRIITLPEGAMTRKTVVIHEEVGERLDKFAKTVRFNKSDIISLALSDFLDRYEDEEK